MNRKIVKVNEELCTGCGACVNVCPQMALEMKDGLSHLINEAFCDAAGQCVVECPVFALTLVDKETAPYDENAVLERILPYGEVALRTHLHHLTQSHRSEELQKAADYLESHSSGINNKEYPESYFVAPDREDECGCM